jgi:hypothetical protein
MNELHIPMWKGGLGTLAAWLVVLPLTMLFRLPNVMLAALFKSLLFPVRKLAGESPVSRAVADLHYVFSRGGEGAAIFRKILTRSRTEELVAIVRGAVVRSLP